MDQRLFVVMSQGTKGLAGQVPGTVGGWTVCCLVADVLVSTKFIRCGSRRDVGELYLNSYELHVLGLSCNVSCRQRTEKALSATLLSAWVGWGGGFCLSIGRTDDDDH